MKKIALTQRLVENSTYKETRETLDINYSKLLFKAGFLPIVMPYEIDFNVYFSKLEIDGVLLTGGNDLNALNENYLSKKRDTYEFELLKYAIKKIFLYLEYVVGYK